MIIVPEVNLVLVLPSPLYNNLVGWPLDKIGIDIVFALLQTYAVPNHTTLTVADKIVTVFFCRFGTPKQIHTDQGRDLKVIF